MRELLERLLTALCAAGIRAQEALPNKLAAQLKAPMTAVGVASVCHLPAAMGRYLGCRADEQTGDEAVYGALLEAEFYFKVVSPVQLGGGRCFQEALGLLDVLLAGVEGMDITRCQMERCQYEPRADQFSCTVTATMRAAAALERTQAQDAAFADFRLEGEVR